MNPRFTFVGGKGGVGKTTCAAAMALRFARSVRTLLVTTDPASSLADVLTVPVGPSPARVRGAARLDACHLAPARAFDEWLASRRQVLATIALRGTYLDRDDVARLLDLSLPGLDELMGLFEITRLALAYEQVVVDTAPTGHTLRLLTMPSLFERMADVLNGLQAQHRAVVSALRGSYREDEADALIREIDSDASRLSGLLRDREGTCLIWVTLPEPMALEETSDAVRALAREGIGVSTLIVNRVTPPAAERCAWHAARRRFESRALSGLSRAFAGIQIRTLPEFAAEPAGLRALARVADACAPFARPHPLPRARARVYADVHGDRFIPGSLVTPETRWLLFGGKGGVGKSTCAAAVAVDAARHAPARQFLLLSTDPAHSLGDVLGMRLTDRAAPVAGFPANLSVREIDARAGFARFRQRYLDSIDRALQRFTRGPALTGADAAAFRDLIDLAPPGIDEVMAVAEVSEVLESREPSATVICDTAPTGHALRLLQTPAVLRGWAQALMTILLKYQSVVGAGDLAALLVQLSKRLRGLEARLEDQSSTGFVIVTRAAALPREESARLRRALESIGLGVRGIIVNAVGTGSCSLCASAARAQRREIQRLRTDVRRRRYAIIEAPAVLPPPHAGSLLEWMSRWRQHN